MNDPILRIGVLLSKKSDFQFLAWQTKYQAKKVKHLKPPQVFMKNVYIQNKNLVTELIFHTEMSHYCC